MYSRSQDRPDRPIRIPEHYSGCAFSPQKQPPPQERPTPKPQPRYPEAAKPSPPPKPSPSANPSVPPTAILLPPPASPQKEESPSAVPAPLGSLLGNLGSAFPFSHGLGFDELLIMGLILLLAGNGQDPNIILWLALLLFCG